MSSITISKQHAQAITFDDYLDDDMKVISSGAWISEGKYEVSTHIFQKEDKYYSLMIGRSGSYYSDWYYDWEDQDEFECQEVEQVQVTTTEWRNVK